MPMNLTRSKQEVVDRAIVLGVVSFRARFEGTRFAASGYDAESAKNMAAGVTDWLRDAGRWAALAAPERVMLERPPLTWDKHDTLAIQDAGLDESTGTLLFCLGVLDVLPAYDRTFDSETLLRLLPFMSDSPFVTREGMPPRDEYASMLASVQLLPQMMIEKEEQRAGAYWWRARSHSLVHSGTIARKELTTILRDGADHSRALGIGVDSEGEFLAFGAPFASLSREDFASCSRIAESRLRALRWLLSEASWLDVDMSS